MLLRWFGPMSEQRLCVYTLTFQVRIQLRSILFAILTAELGTLLSPGFLHPLRACQLRVRSGGVGPFLPVCSPTPSHWHPRFSSLHAQDLVQFVAMLPCIISHHSSNSTSTASFLNALMSSRASSAPEPVAVGFDADAVDASRHVSLACMNSALRALASLTPRPMARKRSPKW